MPESLRSSRRSRQRTLAAAFLSMLLVLSPVAGADGLPELGDSSRADLSPQMERRLGERIMNEIRLHEPTYVDDPEINDYLAALGQRLVAASPERGGEFTFFAIRDNAVNAFAMFGGHIGVNTGTILTAQSESELAGVMAHEIAHVTQHHLARHMQQQKQTSLAGLAAMAVALLAARSNAQVASAAIASSSAAMVQAQLAYSREFEREADRVGYEILLQAGFDPRGMGDFFDRLQRATRLHENNAPVYMRSHPLTLERLSDMQNRAQSGSYRQVPDSLDFHLVRAKLRAQQGTAQEAVADFSRLLRERKHSSEAAARYGLAVAQWRAKEYPAALSTLDGLSPLRVASPMIDALRAEIHRAGGDPAAAQAVYRDALARYPQATALAYGLVDAWHAAGQHDRIVPFIESRLQSHGADARLYGQLARAQAARGQRLAQHRAQAEMYFLQGRLVPAIEQLQFAQRAGDGSFFEQSAVDARLRELTALRREEERERRER